MSIPYNIIYRPSEANVIFLLTKLRLISSIQCYFIVVKISPQNKKSIDRHLMN